MSNSRASRGGAIASEWSPAEIDILCDAFEDAYRRGEEPRIGDYLDQCEGSPRAAIFAELMQVDLELRQESGSQPSYEQYLTSFPEFSDVIETIAFKHALTTHGLGLRPGDASEPGSGIEEDPREAPTAEPGAREKVPTRIAHFQLQQKLGAGGMGEVWRAWDSRLKRTVAIKFPRNRQLNEQELHRFLREGRAAGQLTHSHIASVHEVGRDGSLAYIVSEYIAGQSLQQWLEVGGQALAPGASNLKPTAGEPAASAVPLTAHVVTPRRAAQLCAQLADALHHAHQHGIVHRDLKPSNILLSADGNPHVVDFGIAKWADDTMQLTLEGFALGTPAYMSPEQARGDSAHVDRRADVYALGAILYTMLTGRAPFVGDSQTAVLRAVLTDTPVPPRSLRRDIPRDLETICLQAMQQEPARRYATAEALGADLARFLRGEPILGRRPSLLEKTVRLVRKRPAAAVAGVLAILAVSALGFAGVLVKENRSLLGLVPVTLETNPPGARVVFVPLDETTQEPQGEKAVHPSMRSPVNVELKPGNYLVVAALDDGRFHEVFRTVPKPANSASESRGEASLRKLRKIVLPELTVTKGMAWIGPESAESASQSPPHWKSVGFFIDVKELTFRDRQKCPALAVNFKVADDRQDHALVMDYQQACYHAEKLGKRLPTAGEFQCAALQKKLASCAATDKAPTDFGPVGTPECDRVGSDVPITGLYSNVAEWTTTVVRAAEHGELPGLNMPHLANYRIVKGGDMTVIEGNPTLEPKHRDPTEGCGIERHLTKPGVGMRCVRSAYPRFISKQ